jgi:hypothetical protein
MKKMLLCSLAVLSGCASAQYAPSRLDRVYKARTNPEAVEVYQGSMPTKAFVEIGAVSACCSSDLNSMIALMREKASENGGDALLSLGSSPRGAAWAAVVRY